MSSADATRGSVSEVVEDLRSRIDQLTAATRTTSPSATTTSKRASRSRRFSRPQTSTQTSGATRSQATLDEVHQRLQDGVRGLTTSDGWIRWLSVAATFPTYSLNNQLLIMLQRPDATLVKGYRAWQQLGRQVRKGETAIRILAPITRKATSDDDTEATTVVGYRAASVFALEQTDGDPLPAPPKPQPLAGDAPGQLWNHLADIVRNRGFTLTRADCSPANGTTDFTTKTVTVRPDLSPAQQAKTLTHELGHVLLHQPDTGSRPTCRGIIEVEAESIAYLVAAAHGLDTSNYTFPYLAHWATSTGDEAIDTITSTASRVKNAAQELLDHIAAATANGDTTPAGVTHSVPSGPRRTAVSSEATASDDEALTALRLAADHWGSRAHEIRGYLIERGLSDVAANPHHYGVGYAPPAWTDLVDTLRAYGVSDDALLQTGLAARSRRGAMIDRFRGRLIFPVRDHDHSHVVGAIGRDLTRDTAAPKYINTPTTAWYHKAQLLYGYAEQKTELAQGGTPVIAEGPIDVLAIRGLNQPLVPVAPSGTALSENHVQAIATSGNKSPVIVAFDGDNAGRAAAIRAYQLLKDTFRTVQYLPLAPDHDPATIIAEQRHTDPFQRSNLRPLADLVTDQAIGADATHDALTLIKATHRAAQQIATMPAHEWTRQVNRVSTHLDLSPTAVQQAIISRLAEHYADLDRPLPQRHPGQQHRAIQDATPSRDSIHAQAISR